MTNLMKGRGGNDFSVLLSAFLLLLAACAGGIGYLKGETAAYAAAAILAVTGLFVPQCVMIANQWERMVVLRLGRLRGIRGPGLFFIIPFVDTVATAIDQRIQTATFNAERTLTRDTVPVNVDAIIFWQVHDTERAALEIANYTNGP